MKKGKKHIVFICPHCGREMEYYHTGYLIRDCYDEYYYCEHCNLVAMLEVRFGVPNMVFYRDLDDPEKNAKVHVLR